MKRTERKEFGYEYFKAFSAKLDAQIRPKLYY